MGSNFSADVIVSTYREPDKSFRSMLGIVGLSVCTVSAAIIITVLFADTLKHVPPERKAAGLVIGTNTYSFEQSPEFKKAYKRMVELWRSSTNSPSISGMWTDVYVDTQTPPYVLSTNYPVYPSPEFMKELHRKMLESWGPPTNKQESTKPGTNVYIMEKDPMFEKMVENIRKYWGITTNCPQSVPPDGPLYQSSVERSATNQTHLWVTCVTNVYVQQNKKKFEFTLGSVVVLDRVPFTVVDYLTESDEYTLMRVNNGEVYAATVGRKQLMFFAYGVKAAYYEQ